MVNISNTILYNFLYITADITQIYLVVLFGEKKQKIGF